MDAERGAGEACAREVIAAAVAAVLRRQSRQSVHPSDQAALRLAASYIAEALETEFIVIERLAIPQASAGNRAVA